MMMNPVHHRQLMALNNEGVMLLAQGHFLAALQRFSDSLRLWKDHHSSIILYPSDVPSREIPLKRYDDSHHNTASTSLFPLDIHVVEDNDLENLRFALQYGGSHSVFFAIILRDDITDNHCTAMRHYSTILYNQAIASLIIYECQQMTSSDMSNDDHGWPQCTLLEADQFLTQVWIQQQQQQECCTLVSPSDQWKGAQLLLTLGLVKNCLATHSSSSTSSVTREQHLLLRTPPRPFTKNHFIDQSPENLLKDIHHLEKTLDEYPEKLLFAPSAATPAA